MGTTDVSLGLALLGCLDRRGVDYAVLHNAEALSTDHETSDIDIAIAGDPWEAVACLVEDRGSHGLYLAMLWEYDRCSLTSIWLSETCADGVQLDLLADPKGQGRYGLLTDVVLAGRVKTGAVPAHLSATSQAVYTLSKRIVKRDQERALLAIETLESVAGTDATAELRRLLSPRMRRRAARAFRTRRIGSLCFSPQGEGMRRLGWDRWRPRLSLFGLSRLVTATGAIISIPACREEVQLLADRASLIFPHAMLKDQAPSRFYAWWLTRGPRLVLVANGKAHSGLPTSALGHSIAEQLSLVTWGKIANRTRAGVGRAQ